MTSFFGIFSDWSCLHLKDFCDTAFFSFNLMLAHIYVKLLVSVFLVLIICSSFTLIIPLANIVYNLPSLRTTKVLSASDFLLIWLSRTLTIGSTTYHYAKSYSLIAKAQLYFLTKSTMQAPCSIMTPAQATQPLLRLAIDRMLALPNNPPPNTCLLQHVGLENQIHDFVCDTTC